MSNLLNKIFRTHKYVLKIDTVYLLYDDIIFNSNKYLYFIFKTNN